MDTKEPVEKFLLRFHECTDVTETFTGECCYWFAAILFGRFIREGATIMYDEVSNHFGTRIRGVVYDITGDVTHDYKWIPWETITDESHRARIVRDCIMFE